LPVQFQPQTGVGTDWEAVFGSSLIASGILETGFASVSLAGPFAVE